MGISWRGGIIQACVSRKWCWSASDANYLSSIWASWCISGHWVSEVVDRRC